MGKKLLFIGSLMVDIVCPIPAFPQPGQGVVAGEFHHAIGGCAFNAANIARQLGASCQLIAPIGKGTYARFVEEELGKYQLSGLPVDTELDNGAAVCLVEQNGERTMITMPGIERCFQDAWFQAIDASAFDAAYLCGYELDGEGGEAILRFLERNPHLQVFFSSGPVICRLARERMTRMAALTPVWHINDQEARALTGCDSLLEAGRMLAAGFVSKDAPQTAAPEAVIITAGSDGAYVFEGSTYTHVPTRPIKPLDTIGAGDSHIGTIMALWAAGRSFVEAAEVGNRIASAICQISGASFTDQQFASSPVADLRI